MVGSELLGAQHRVDQVRKRRDAQQQEEQHHDCTYTRSQNVTKASIAANDASPSITIPSASTMFLLRSP
jgi:hypothetical protein